MMQNARMALDMIEIAESPAPSPLRILYHHRTAASDGMRVHIEEIVGALRARGHIVKVVGPGGSSSGARVSRLEAATDMMRRRLPAVLFEILELLYNIPAWFRLSREAERFMPDVLYERNNLFLLAGLFLKWRRRIPMILEVNAPLAAERARFGNLRLRMLARACEKLMWRHGDIVLPVTDVLAQQVIRQRGVMTGVHVVPNGVRLDLAPSEAALTAVREKLALPADSLVLGFVGFVRAWHGVGWAIEALTRLPDHVHLVVVGDGPARPLLEARAADLGLAHRVHFTGDVPHGDIPAHVQLFDIALQTAAVPYASPLKLFEYMALGRAIIAPDQPNIREILQDHLNALLFDPHDRDGFLDALGRLCRDGAMRRRLGAAARCTVEEIPLTWAHNAARIESFASRLIETMACRSPLGAAPSSSGASGP
jgi:glycosyltransferase involved in cell wall biosynthesis